MDLSARRVWVEERLVDLTAVEFDLLAALAQHHSIVLTREQLLEKAGVMILWRHARGRRPYRAHPPELGDDRFHRDHPRGRLPLRRSKVTLFAFFTHPSGLESLSLVCRRGAGLRGRPCHRHQPVGPVCV